MKVLLVTLAIGSVYIQHYNSIFRSSQEDYARKHGYDFRVVTKFLDQNIQIPAAISFNKILVCSQEWSNDYDFIIFVDADIIININSPPIHSYIDYEGKIGVVDEFSQPTKEQRLQIQQNCGFETSATEHFKLCQFDLETDKVFNSGVLVLQPKLHSQFLEEIYNKYVQISLTHSRKFIYEQTCIGYELHKADMYKIIDNKWNALWSLAKFLNTNSLEGFIAANYFIHFAGGVDHDKIHKKRIGIKIRR